MDAHTNLAQMAGLIADGSRAAMLCSLAGGETRPASELAALANVSPQTASRHLGLLVAAGFLTVSRSGRNKYYRLRGPEIAAALESLAGISRGSAVHNGTAQRIAPDLVSARTCYDHLAGVLGVALCDRASAKGFIRDSSRGFELTVKGEEVFRTMGVEIPVANAGRRRFAYPCLDWSQRRPHIGGALGAALLHWLLASKAVARCRGSRAVRVTDRGTRLLEEAFAIRFTRTGHLAA